MHLLSKGVSALKWNLNDFLVKTLAIFWCGKLHYYNQDGKKMFYYKWLLVQESTFISTISVSRKLGGDRVWRPK